MIVVDPHHWMTEEGDIPEIPRLRSQMLRVATLIEYGGPMARMHGRETLLPCSRRPGRKPCPGLLVVVKRADDALHAFCPTCGSNEFLIHDWQDTPWAEGPMEPVPVGVEGKL